MIGKTRFSQARVEGLRNQDHSPPDQRVRCESGDVGSLEPDLTLPWLEQTGDRPERRRFSSDIGPNDRDDLALRDAERDVPER